ncbi:alpha/beta fold hydrolase [Sphingomicrobium nitratireducens]|uniref:alpha/beta fold hydrolase n=1 Tax=Sphingomicrobium nitratireducens TaxID=2964666 RepID=UPI00223E8FA0|nr:alpha/beta hydrolase [Sphingomicrobium nitratireducens]
MKSLTILAAALAATALPLPALAAPAQPTTEAQTLTHDHIRTTLHGTSGPVAVLIPGMSTPGAVWDDTVEAFAGDHRLLVVTVRGFDGERGTANEAEGAIPGIVADLAADLEQRDLGPATIVGHSLGGLLALKFGLDHPELATNLLIVDALPFFGTVFDPNATLESAEPQAIRMRDMMIAGAEMMRAMGEKGTDSGQGAMGMSVDEATRVKIANWSIDAEPLAVAQLVYEDTMMDLRQDIAALEMPVTVLHFATGEHADMAKARYATDYAALDGVRMVPADNSAHFVQLDRPDLFRAELAALLKR